MSKWINRKDIIQCLTQEMSAIKSAYPDMVSCVDFTDKINNTDFLVCGNGYTAPSLSDADKFDVMIGSYGFPDKRHVFMDTYPDDVRSIYILSSRNIIDSYSDNLTEDELGGMSYE